MRRSPGRRLALGFLVCALLLGAAVVVWWVRVDAVPRVEAPSPVAIEDEPGVPPLAPARLAAPVVYDLSAILAQLEEAVPRTFGDLEIRESHPEHDRVQVAYRAERSTFTAEMRGDTARISATLSYGGRVWYDPPLLPAVSAGCGTDGEDALPRARVSLSSRLEVDQDWVLRSRVQVDAVETVSEEDRDRCRVTPLRVDVTGTALNAVRSALEGRTDEMDRRVAGVDVRSRLQGVWHTLQEPVELADDLWLLVNPVGVTRGRTLGEGTVVTVDVGMSARPAIVLGPLPENAPTDLPLLEEGTVDEQALLLVEGRIHYPQAGALLTRQLRERDVELGARLIRIRELSLEGVGGGRVGLRVDFEGSARGRIYLVGRPELDLASGEIHVPDLDFDVETRNVLVGGVAWLAQEPLVNFLRERARLPVAEVMSAAREQLLRGLNRDLSDEVSVEGDVVSTRLLEVVALREFLVVHAEAEAHAVIRVRQGVQESEVDGN